MDRADKRLILIPGKFHSFKEQQPFDKCIECDKYLLDDDTEYIIEIAKRKYEGYSAEDTVFDYAICMDCALKSRNEFSEESLKRLDQFFAPGFVKLRQAMEHYNVNNPEFLLNKCLIQDDHVDTLNEYQIYAHCRGRYLSDRLPPYLIGQRAIEEVIPLLSKPTKDFLDGFFQKHFGPDPHIFEPDPSTKLVFV
jgi:hypothetical protein